MFGFNAQASQQWCAQAYALRNRLTYSTQFKRDYAAKMTLKQFFKTRNFRLQCSNLFKSYSLINRLFARNCAYIERIFNAFRDIVYMENEDSNGVSVYFLYFAYP